MPKTLREIFFESSDLSRLINYKKETMYIANLAFIFILSITQINGLFRECKEKSDIVFLIDVSVSVGPFNLQKTKFFIKRLLLPANIDSGDVRVGVLIFDHNVQIEFHLNTYTSKRDLFEHIDSIILRGGFTNTADALRVMNVEMFSKANGDRQDIQNVAIVITDGMSSTNANETIPRAEQARLNGVHIFAIGIGDVDEEEIRGIATLPSFENAFILEGFAQLRLFKDDFFKFCTVVDPRTACFDESPSETTDVTTKMCTVYNVWEIQCDDIAWKNSDNMTLRISDDSSAKMNCTVNDKMTLTTWMAFVPGESNWTAVYSPMTEVLIEKDISGSSRNTGRLAGLVCLVVAIWSRV